jgi:hypothetical protein
VGLPKPDLILFLQLQLLDAAARGEFGLERYETGTFQKQVLLCFQQLMEEKNLNWKVSHGNTLPLSSSVVVYPLLTSAQLVQFPVEPQGSYSGSLPSDFLVVVVIRLQ